MLGNVYCAGAGSLRSDWFWLLIRLFAVRLGFSNFLLSSPRGQRRSQLIFLFPTLVPLAVAQLSCRLQKSDQVDYLHRTALRVLCHVHLGHQAVHAHRLNLLHVGAYSLILSVLYGFYANKVEV